MRYKIFKWIEKTFGIFYPGSAMSFNELVTDQLIKGHIFKFIEISFQIKIKDAPKVWMDMTLHEEWKEKIT